MRFVAILPGTCKIKLSRVLQSSGDACGMSFASDDEIGMANHSITNDICCCWFSWTSPGRIQSD